MDCARRRRVAPGNAERRELWDWHAVPVYGVGMRQGRESLRGGWDGDRCHQQARNRKGTHIQAARDGAVGMSPSQRPERRNNWTAGGGTTPAEDAGERMYMTARTGAEPTKCPPRGLNHPLEKTTLTTEIGRKQHRSSEEASPEMRSSLQPGQGQSLCSPGVLHHPSRASTISSNTVEERAVEGETTMGGAERARAATPGRRTYQPEGGVGRSFARSDLGGRGRAREEDTGAQLPPRIRARRGRAPSEGMREAALERDAMVERLRLDRGWGRGPGLKRGTRPPRRHLPWARRASPASPPAAALRGVTV